MVKEKREKIEYPEYVVKHILYCDNCDSEMYQDNIILTTWPEQYSYFCPVCGRVETSFTHYDNTMKSFNEWYRNRKIQ